MNRALEFNIIDDNGSWLGRLLTRTPLKLMRYLRMNGGTTEHYTDHGPQEEPRRRAHESKYRPARPAAQGRGPVAQP
jgi:hypothetical protein